MMKFSVALILGCLGWVAMPVVTLAKQPIVSSIGNIQNTKEIQGAGCSLQRKGKKGFVFWSAFEQSALVNIDGKDRVLKLFSETPSQADLIKKGDRDKQGDRSTVIYKSGKMTVRIDRMATRVCRQGDQGCETTAYDGKLKLRIGDKQQVIAVEGECGS
jgi:hypothetical protein